MMYDYQAAAVKHCYILKWPTLMCGLRMCPLADPPNF